MTVSIMMNAKLIILMTEIRMMTKPEIMTILVVLTIQTRIRTLIMIDPTKKKNSVMTIPLITKTIMDSKRKISLK